MKILGISGSPVPDSNTDRLILQLLKTSELEYEFVKLSNLTVRPCRACKRCVEDNICKVDDDFPDLAEKVKKAQILAIGGYTPYRGLDGYTKAFLERLWSMRHVHSLNENKYVVTIVTGLAKQLRDAALKAVAVELAMERMYHVAEFGVVGNVPCLTCGYGDDCKNSGIPHLFGENAKSSDVCCIPVENQPVWEEVTSLGKLIGRFMNGKEESLPRIMADLS